MVELIISTVLFLKVDGVRNRSVWSHQLDRGRTKRKKERKRKKDGRKIRIQNQRDKRELGGVEVRTDPGDWIAGQVVHFMSARSKWSNLGCFLVNYSWRLFNGSFQISDLKSQISNPKSQILNRRSQTFLSERDWNRAKEKKKKKEKSERETIFLRVWTTSKISKEDVSSIFGVIFLWF